MNQFYGLDMNMYFSSLVSDKEPKGLYDPIRYSLDAGGKRLRPRLVMLANQLLGGDEKDALPAAIAIEVFHTFTLLHDDVMDHSLTRRGRESVYAKWGTNTAILSGDQMLIEAYKRISQVPESLVPQVLRLFNIMATEVCEGQQWDMEFEKRCPSLEEYIAMIGKKTSALIAYALRIGACIAHGSEQQQQALYDFGYRLGLAFQIQDDYLDCFGTAETLGKPIGGDIREHKKTYLYLVARQKGADTSILDSGDFEKVISVYQSLQVDQLTLHEVQRLTEEAVACLESLPHNDAYTQLRQLAINLLNRNN